MIIRRYLRVAILAFLLTGLVLPSFSVKQKERPCRRGTNIVRRSIITDTIHAVPTDTLNAYSGHVVSSEVRVYSPSVLLIDSTKVAASGSLRITAEDTISILSDTEVELGGELMLNGATQNYISFTYSTIGFRLLKKHETNIQ